LITSKIREDEVLVGREDVLDEEEVAVEALMED
jgi:hypothetical protein